MGLLSSQASSYQKLDMLILSSLLFILFELSRSTGKNKEEFIAVTIPRSMESVSIRAVVETTECSVTCGVGSKIEKRCLVDKSGIQKDCEVVRVECLSNWLCDLEIYTLRVGDYFTMNCQIPPTGIIGGRHLYFWRMALGIVSINDIYFRPLKVRNSTIVFESIQEKAAGTYRCDVQREDDLKVLKRIYFGVRVVTPGIMDINYDKYIISKQKLVAMAEEATTPGTETKVELYGGIYTYVGIGSSVGIMTGLLLLVLIRCTTRSKKEDTDDYANEL